MYLVSLTLTTNLLGVNSYLLDMRNLRLRKVTAQGLNLKEPAEVKPTPLRSQTYAHPILLYCSRNNYLHSRI